MMSINERFKELRKNCKMTQEEWGKILGLTRSGVTDIEAGRRNVTAQHLIMLSNWKEKRVDIEWLKTGDGEMFLELPEEDEVAAYVSELLEDDGNNPLYTIIKEIMRTYSELTPKSQEVLCDFSEKLIKNLKEKEG
jgi:transcriptional regulator with XRE-family HTH domain